MADCDRDIPLRDKIAIECLAVDRMWEPATMEEIEGLFGVNHWTQMDLAARRAYHMADAMIAARGKQDPEIQAAEAAQQNKRGRG